MARGMDKRRAAPSGGGVRTIFHRTISPLCSPVQARDMRGAWQDHYSKWWMVTCEHLSAELVELVP
jgi:hypothetical protein